MIPTGRYRVVQVHPTLRCNLQCLHCYSDSGPTKTTALPIELAAAAVRDAAAAGYDVLAVSGGEPLLYGELDTLLDAARGAGLKTALTTNGTVLTRWRLDALRDRLDLMTLSLDGVPESHDRIRNSPGAFDRMARSLPPLRASGIPFGIIFTLTQHNVHELEWVAGFAREHGAELLQIHPLELSGRARSRMSDEHPDDIELGFGFAEALRLRERHGDEMRIQVDVATRSGLEALSRLEGAAGPPARLAEAVSPLVVEAAGTVVPLTYGFPRGHALGSLHESSLADLAERWLSGGGYERFRSVVARIHDDDVWPDRVPVLSLYEAAVSLAQQEDGGGAEDLVPLRAPGS